MRAELVAKALGGSRSGSGWVMRCPAHNDRNPSLSVSDSENGLILLKCFAGCETRAVIDALKSLGLWRSSTRGSLAGSRMTSKPKVSTRKNIDCAMRIWNEAKPAAGTLVEVYLRARGITISLPPSLRFHPRLKHRSGTFHPTMIALVTDSQSAEEIAIHRTYLATDGSAKALVTPDKMMLGPTRGGVVRLTTATDKVMIGEGIETVLSAMQATDRPGWAALSTSGLTSLVLPTSIASVVILADGDSAGMSAADQAARHWAGQNRSVRIARAPTGFDFNDILTGNFRVEESSAA